MRRTVFRLGVTLVGAALLATVLVGPGKSRPSAAASSAPHVMVIIEENQGPGIIGSSSAPYLTSLAQQYASAANWFAIEHNSPCDYIALISGSDQGSSCGSGGVSGGYSAPTLVDTLSASSIGWKAYMEGAPTPCYLGNTYGGAGGYMQIHNPFMYFHSTSAPGQKCNNVVPFTSFAGDLNSPSPPAFVWVTPTGCHQMHDSCAPLNDPVKQGDQWLKSTMQTVLASSWYAQGGTVIITWDEGTNSQGWNCPNGCGGNTSNGGGQIPTVVVSSGANGQISDGGNHYGTLRSIAKAYGVPFLVPTADGDAANGDLLAGLARSTTTSLAASPNPSTSSQTVSLTATVSASGGGIPSGTVTFRDGSQSLGSVGLDPSGTAQLASSSLSVGSHPLTAAYQGASGFISSTSPQVTQVVQSPPPPPPSPSPGPRSGYRMVASDGGIFSFGGAAFYGSKGGTPLNKPIVGLAVTPSGRGYWMVASDGGIFAFGDAGFYGSMGGTRLNQPIVGMVPTPDGGGYWMVASDGGIFAFGSAKFYGSQGGKPLNKPILGMTATPDGGGYWMVASDGGIFAFGNAAFYGSMGGRPLNRPIVGMAATPDHHGYWMVASDGGIFAFGTAGFYGSQGGKPLNKPIVGMTQTSTGRGYWLVASDGGIFTFGDARFLGSTGGIVLNQPIVGIAA